MLYSPSSCVVQRPLMRRNKKCLNILDWSMDVHLFTLSKLQLLAYKWVSKRSRLSLSVNLPALYSHADFGAFSPPLKKKNGTLVLPLVVRSVARPSRRPTSFWPRSYPGTRPPFLRTPGLGDFSWIWRGVRRYWSGWWRRASTPTGPRDVPLDTQGRITELILKLL